jgi:2-hydroxy-3-keto-5-methylthiopentenyl-1-phosphate phosphatase
MHKTGKEVCLKPSLRQNRILHKREAAHMAIETLKRKEADTEKAVIREMLLREKFKDSAEHIFKNGKEFIVSQYGVGRYFVAVVDEQGGIVPKFPFKTLEEVKHWIETEQ